MPLVLPELQNSLVDIYNKGKKGNPSPATVGLRTGGAYLKYCSAGVNAAGFPFTAMPGSTPLGQDLANLYLGTVPDGRVFALKMAKAFMSCLDTWMSVNQTVMVPVPGLPGLQSDLMDLFSKPKGHSSLFAMALGRALHTFTISAVVSGVVPNAPGIPFTGPIS
jgi:hypothetical protein